MNKYCVLSVDNNPDYYSLLPLVCHSWQKLGYTPIIISVNISKDLIMILHAHCPGALILNHPLTDGVKDSTMAQLYRLWPPYENDDDIFITADADMVIASDIFAHDVSQGQIVSYGYDLTGRSELPICYVKATATKWRELMGEFYIPDAAYSDQWETYWSTDQQLLTKRAHEYGMDRITFVDRLHNHPRGLPTGRWDRACWDIIPDTIIDVHMKRNDWNAQYQVAERLWPGEDHSFITKFREALEGGKAIEGVKGIADHYNYPSELLTSPLSCEISRLNINDEFHFLESIDNWCNHRPLLLLALSVTRGDVYEFGCGDGSTPYLRKYCEAAGRRFRSFESHEVWALKCGSEFVKNWDDDMLYWPCSVAFIDHAPGEHRKVAIERMMDKADIICVHDTEIGGAGDYGFEPVFAKFKYRLNYNKTGGGAGATLVSNKIDVNRFRGLSLGPYTFDND